MKNRLLLYIKAQLSLVLQKEISIKRHQQVYSGDINQTFIIDTSEGLFFIKTNDRPLPGLFEKEYNGLTLLKQKSILKVPQAIIYGVFADVHFLVMECLEQSDFTQQSWKTLGEGLAGLHRQTQRQFGLDKNNYIGSLPQQNQFTDTWAAFYATQRILPLMQKAFDNKLCTTDNIREAEKLCLRCSELLPNEPPALLHGDLWSGNVMACSNGEVAIYDPAVYYGHREMDIAMTLLFGGFDTLFYQHYNETYPLHSGWQQRVGICQLYPLLFHLNLFGIGYYSRVKSILAEYK